MKTKYNPLNHADFILACKGAVEINKEDFYINFDAFIKKIRFERDIPFYKIAKQLKISKTLLCDMAKGRRNITVKILNRINEEYL